MRADVSLVGHIRTRLGKKLNNTRRTMLQDLKTVATYNAWRKFRNTKKHYSLDPPDDWQESRVSLTNRFSF